MAALDLSAITQLPYVAWTATPGTANLCREIILPNKPIKVTLNNRDKASKGLVFSTDQTLTDGGAAPANQYMTVDGQTIILHGENRLTGMPTITKLFVFSPAHTAVNCEILLQEGEL